MPPPTAARLDLGTIKQPSGKVLTVFAVAGTLDTTDAHSNTFDMEWPKGSGRIQSFPEIDRVGWFPIAEARVKLLKGHVPFLDRLLQHADS